ncbi:MAG: hypothetical protein LWX55_11575 [Deltaproteobacteria bacterium]|jgi:hypothetical protein|nr:hypothetical protein [Deltaproteobacteria bacterium]
MIRFLTFGFTVLMLVVSGMTYAQENNSFNMAPLDEGLAGSSFLEVEAGISAYGQVSSANLDLAENAFKNVEKKTTEYIIGSVALDDYGEADDVHVYVDISGWIIAYYLNEEKASKIIDWVDYYGNPEITSTKLSDAIDIITLEMLVIPPDIKYFDFRYPDATKMMIVTDEEFSNGTETFNIMAPSDHPMYSRTWSYAIYDWGTGSTGGNIKIDSVELHSGSSSGGWAIWEGDITPTQLFPDIFHEISLYHSEYRAGASYVGIMLIYAEPQ